MNAPKSGHPMPRGNPNLYRLDRTPWPQERADRLRKMFAAGCSDDEISLALGVSQRAVIGKRLRLGLRRWPGTDDPLAMALRRRARQPKPE